MDQNPERTALQSIADEIVSGTVPHWRVAVSEWETGGGWSVIAQTDARSSFYFSVAAGPEAAQQLRRVLGMFVQQQAP